MISYKKTDDQTLYRLLGAIGEIMEQRKAAHKAKTKEQIANEIDVIWLLTAVAADIAGEIDYRLFEAYYKE